MAIGRIQSHVFSAIKTSQIVPWAAAGCVLMLTAGLWRGTNIQQRRVIEAENQLVAVNLASQLQADVTTHLTSLHRMAKRWEANLYTQASWEADVLAYLEDIPGIRAIEWVDTQGYVRWVAPLAGNEKALNLHLGFEKNRADAMNTARMTGLVTLSRVVELVQGERGYLVFVPVRKNDQHDGFILGVFSLDIWLDSFLVHATPGHHIRILEDQIEVMAHSAGGNESWTASNPYTAQDVVHIAGATWSIQVQPSAMFLRQAQSPISFLILTTGAVIALTVGLLVYFWQSLHASTARVLASEELFRSVVEGAPNAIVVVDQTGCITLVNPQAERLFGYSRQELMGRLIEVLLPSRYRQNHPQQRRDFYSNPQMRAMGAGRDLYAMHKNGSEIPVEIGLNPIITSQGPLVLAAIVDITKRMESEETIRQINKSLQAKSEEMERFAYTVSHDLKSPLVTMQGFVGYLKQDLEVGREDRVMDSIQRVERSMQRMGDMITDLLELSRIGKLADNPSPIDIARLLHLIADDLDEQLKNAKAQLIIEGDMPVIHADPMRIRELFENLLVNALKYGCSGEVPEIRVGSQIIDQEVRFFVRDNGPGIDPKFHHKIFDMFQRLDNQREGTGIGLAIVRRIAETNNGKVWVESEAGRGAVFWISFPASMMIKSQAPQISISIKTPGRTQSMEN